MTPRVATWWALRSRSNAQQRVSKLQSEKAYIDSLRANPLLFQAVSLKSVHRAVQWYATLVVYVVGAAVFATNLDMPLPISPIRNLVRSLVTEREYEITPSTVVALLISLIYWLTIIYLVTKTAGITLRHDRLADHIYLYEEYARGLEETIQKLNAIGWKSPEEPDQDTTTRT